MIVLVSTFNFKAVTMVRPSKNTCKNERIMPVCYQISRMGVAVDLDGEIYQYAIVWNFSTQLFLRSPRSLAICDGGLAITFPP